MARKLTNDDFMKRSTNIHSDFYKYNDEYKNSHTKIKILCPIHGEFEQKPYSHLKGIGCPKCGFKKTSDFNKMSDESFIEKSNMIHKSRYNYDKVNYKSNKDNVIINCPIHGDFNQLPQHHLNGHGCPECAPKKQNKSNDIFISQSKKIHDDKYHYIEDYKGAHVPISIECPIHGDFLQTPNSHLKGRGCPDCQYSNSSKMEKSWLDILSIDKKYRNAFIKIDGKLYKFDAYIPETNTIYEFYGDFWHGNPNKYKDGNNLKNKLSFSELYKKTMDREVFLKSKGYNIISIWEDEFIKQSKK
jgi:hypothetical protein